MKRALFFGAIAVTAVAGLVYRANVSDEESASETPTTAQTGGAASTSSAEPRGAAREAVAPPSAAGTGRTSQPSDPRLAALAISKDNGLIEFVPGPDGKIIKEIDNDPNSPGYRKSLREYLYAGNNVIGLVAYRYFSDHVEITRTQVIYKSDGTVDQYSETTDYDYGNKRPATVR